MGQEDFHQGDIVSITITGKIEHIFGGKCLVTVHGHDIPILKSQITEILEKWHHPLPKPEQPEKK